MPTMLMLVPSLLRVQLRSMSFDLQVFALVGAEAAGFGSALLPPTTQ
jgi:hypothetical protein